MSTMESEIDAVLEPLARAVMAAWDGEPAALRLVTSQARPIDRLACHRTTPRARPTSNVIPIGKPFRLRPV